MIPIPETGNCALCGARFTHYGNNPDPLGTFEDRVCDDCNTNVVIPARLGWISEPDLFLYRKRIEASRA